MTIKSVLKHLCVATLITAPIFLTGFLTGCTSGACSTKFDSGACTNPSPNSSGNSNPAPGPFSIAGTVSGLASGSNGVVLQDNGGDNVTMTGNGSFTFKTAITSGSGYNVSILSQPTSPAQTCVVSGGNGTATSNVTSVQVACSSGGGDVISGQVTGLLGSGLVLQDNGTDSLSVTANGGFQFPTTVTGGGAYNVTVLAQPTKPTQTCTVASGTGTASGNVGNVVVTCSSGTLALSGSVSGLSGTGLVLKNSSDGDTVGIAADGNFQFPLLLVSGTTYNVTIFSQPTGPGQTCTVSNGNRHGDGQRHQRSSGLPSGVPHGRWPGRRSVRSDGPEFKHGSGRTMAATICRSRGTELLRL